jgi:hypothetical protein
MQLAQNFVLSLWSNATAALEAAAGAAPSASSPLSGATAVYLALYFGLGLGSVVLVLARSALLVNASIAASRKLHRELLSKLVRLPMSFFDTQPTGEWDNEFLAPFIERDGGGKSGAPGPRGARRPPPSPPPLARPLPPGGRLPAAPRRAFRLTNHSPTPRPAPSQAA